MGDIQMPPQGAHIAYVDVQVDAARTDYETALYPVSSSGNDTRRLTGPAMTVRQCAVPRLVQMVESLSSLLLKQGPLLADSGPFVASASDLGFNWSTQQVG